MENRLQTFKAFIRARPLSVIAWNLYRRLFGIKIPAVTAWVTLVKDRSGVEIGGPSGIFTLDNYLPIYPYVKSLDGVNFSNTTVWEGHISDDSHFEFGGRKGSQIIAEGTSLSRIADEAYDFVLSSNNLEHIANPIKALVEWRRVIKPGGVIVVVLPRKESNFDHARAVTTFEHLKNDYENNIAEDDLTHLGEILELHDLKRDPHAGSLENFRERSLNNLENRCLHHHVFDIDLLKEIFRFIKMDVLLSNSSPSDHFIAAEK